jgi:hypothetical protein
MKKILLFFTLISTCVTTRSQSLSFTITSNSGSNSITCAYPALNLSAGTSYTGLVSYSWSNGTFSATGANVNISNPGTYTVMMMTQSGGNTTQTLSIGINTTAPSSAVTPTFQAITCNVSSAVSVSASASAANMTHYFISPFGGTVIANTQAAIYSPLAPGNYTHVLTDNVNGCSTTKTFTITSSSGFPTYGVSSPQNFTLGCNTKSVAIINIINGSTAPTPGGPLSYTILTPGSGTTTNSGTLSTQSTYTVNVPGDYIVVTKDNTNFCETRVPISIVQNIIVPAVNVSVPTLTLTCFTPAVVLQGSSTSTNLAYQWLFPGTPGSVSGSSIQVNANMVAPTSSLVANFSLVTTENNNTCKSTTIIPIFQNVYPPMAVINNGGNSTLTCFTSSIVLTNVSVTGIPPSTFPTNMPVVATTWAGPSPQSPATLITTYVANTPGVYTMTAQDQNNGCLSTATMIITDGKIFPLITPGGVICLSGGSATLSPNVSGTSSVTYSWTSPSGATVSGANTAVLTTNLVGIYTVAVTGTQSGCTSTSQMNVSDCVGIHKNSKSDNNIRLFPNPGNGLFTITLEGSNQRLMLEVYNSVGELIKKQELNSEKNFVNMFTEASGIYFMCINDGNAVVRTLKFVKE